MQRATQTHRSQWGGDKDFMNQNLPTPTQIKCELQSPHDKIVAWEEKCWVCANQMRMRIVCFSGPRKENERKGEEQRRTTAEGPQQKGNEAIVSA